jgi:hypothetical protein
VLPEVPGACLLGSMLGRRDYVRHLHGAAGVHSIGGVPAQFVPALCAPAADGCCAFIMSVPILSHVHCWFPWHALCGRGSGMSSATSACSLPSILFRERVVNRPALQRHNCLSFEPPLSIPLTGHVCVVLIRGHRVDGCRHATGVRVHTSSQSVTCLNITSCDDMR